MTGPDRSRQVWRVAATAAGAILSAAAVVLGARATIRAGWPFDILAASHWAAWPGAFHDWYAKGYVLPWGLVVSLLVLVLTGPPIVIAAAWLLGKYSGWLRWSVGPILWFLQTIVLVVWDRIPFRLCLNVKHHQPSIVRQSPVPSPSVTPPPLLDQHRYPDGDGDRDRIVAPPGVPADATTAIPRRPVPSVVAHGSSAPAAGPPTAMPKAPQAVAPADPVLPAMGLLEGIADNPPIGADVPPLPPPPPTEEDPVAVCASLRALVTRQLVDQGWKTFPEVQINADAGAGFEPDRFDDCPLASIPLLAVAEEELVLVHVPPLTARGWQASTADPEAPGTPVWTHEDGVTCLCEVALAVRAQKRFMSHHGGLVEASRYGAEVLSSVVLFPAGYVDGLDEATGSWAGWPLRVAELAGDEGDEDILSALFGGPVSSDNVEPMFIAGVRQGSAETVRLLRDQGRAA